MILISLATYNLMNFCKQVFSINIDILHFFPLFLKKVLCLLSERNSHLNHQVNVSFMSEITQPASVVRSKSQSQACAPILRDFEEWKNLQLLFNFQSLLCFMFLASFNISSTFLFPMLLLNFPFFFFFFNRVAVEHSSRLQSLTTSF